MSGRSARAASRTSRNPSVVMRPVFAPFRSMMALVAMVEPWIKNWTSFGSTFAFFKAFRTPSMKAGGVDGTLAVMMSPPSCGRQTISLNVPPMSTPTT